MPHLVFCGRYWRIAGDELSLPTVCAVVGRIVWSIVLMAILVTTTSRSTCSYGLTAYLSTALFLFVSSILCEVWLIRVSLQGSIVETHRRSDLGKVLFCHMILGTFEFGSAVFGVVVIDRRVRIPCLTDALDTRDTDVILLSLVVISQLIDITALLCCCYLFSANKVNDPMVSEPLDEKWANSAWERRCRTMCKSLQLCTCNIFGGSNVADDLEKVAKILTAFFHHEGFLDVVPSDVVAGILLVRMQQRAGLNRFGGNDVIGGGVTIGGGGSYSRMDDIESRSLDSIRGEELLALSPEIRRRYISQAKRRALDESQLADFNTLNEIAHFSVYAMSIYTHLMFMFVNPCSGVCQLCHSMVCSNVCKNPSCFSRCAPGGSAKSKRRYHGDAAATFPQSSIRGDNCLGINEAAVSQMTKNINNELVFASFENTVHVKPFAVFVDHETQKTVITIRGTISLEDWITDGISDSVELEEAGKLWGFDGKNRFGHEGFVTAALRIRQELESNILIKGLFRNDVSPVHRESIHAPLNADPMSCARYPLVVVGHSLGAGIAVLLAMFLRNAYPDVRCFGYGMPGAVVDDATARDCSSYITAVILGTDMVPRMSFRAMSDMREQVLDAIARARVNKAEIMKTIFKDLNVDEFLYRPGEEPPSKFRTMVNNFTARVSERERGMQHPLFLPGRIIHFVKLEVSENNWLAANLCCKKMHYKPYETSWEAFSELILSPTMFIDHFIDRYVKNFGK